MPKKILAGLFSFTILANAHADEALKPSTAQTRNRPPIGYKGIVSSEDRDASEWGAQILREGGNAADAAIATAFYLSVTRPYYGALGGGGFFVFCPAPKDKQKSACSTLDMREEAPAKATRDMYTVNGQEKSELSNFGALAVGTPGLVDGYLTAQKSFGKLTRQKVLARPIFAAEKGFRFTGLLALRLEAYWKNMNAEMKKTFACHEGKAVKETRPCRAGDVLKQKDLAKVLREILKHGREGFYGGWVAKKMIASLQKAGGILSLEDLKSYRTKARSPIVTEFDDLEIVGMPPPSSGAMLIAQMFAYLGEARKSGALDDGFGSVNEIHALGTGMSLAFADTLNRVSDPDFVKVPVGEMLDKDYLQKRWSRYYSAKKWRDPAPGELAHTGTDTTQISVIDREGNAAALTISSNGPFGANFMPEGTGLVLNNIMNDFTVIPGGKPNIYGVVSGAVNEIAPGKRPLSSMSPTIVRDKNSGVVRVAIGGQGGPNLATATYLTLVNRFVHGMSLIDAIAAPRFHHQWRPASLQLERNAFGNDLVRALNARADNVTLIDGSARLHGVERLPSGEVWGGADPRTEGASVPE